MIFPHHDILFKKMKKETKKKKTLNGRILMSLLVGLRGTHDLYLLALPSTSGIQWKLNLYVSSLKDKILHLYVWFCKNPCIIFACSALYMWKTEWESHFSVASLKGENLIFMCGFGENPCLIFARFDYWYVEFKWWSFFSVASLKDEIFHLYVWFQEESIFSICLLCRSYAQIRVRITLLYGKFEILWWILRYCFLLRN